MMNKKILILTDKINYNDGVTTYLYNFICSANRNNVEFYLCSPGGDRINDFKQLLQKLYISKRFDYTRRNYFNTLFYIIHIIVLCSKNRIEIIHSQNYFFANIAKIVSKFIKVRTVQTHNNLFQEINLKHFVSDVNIAVNEHIYDYALSNKKVIQNCIKLIRYGLIMPEENCVKDTSFLVVAAARLTIEKGIDTFIKAVSMLDKSFRNRCKFCVAGEGNYENELRKLNNELNAGIVFLGKLNGIYDLLIKSKILVNPSIWDAEGFPLTLIEAGAYKNLVITSNFRGVLSVFDPDKDGFMFEKNDAFTLKVILQEAISNYDHYYYKVENFHRKVRKLFDVKTTVKQTLKLYDELS